MEIETTQNAASKQIFIVHGDVYLRAFTIYFSTDTAAMLLPSGGESLESCHSEEITWK